MKIISPSGLWKHIELYNGLLWCKGRIVLLQDGSIWAFMLITDLSITQLEDWHLDIYWITTGDSCTQVTNVTFCYQRVAFYQVPMPNICGLWLLKCKDFLVCIVPTPHCEYLKQNWGLLLFKPICFLLHLFLPFNALRKALWIAFM